MEYCQGFSIIICCHNSATKIEQTLHHISQQKTLIDFEVILVDNNCTDSTISIAKMKWKSCDTNKTLRIINEEKPGQMHARKTGILNALYDLLLFCDDDNLLDEYYLQNAYATFQKDEKIAAVGGIGKALTTVPFPDWFDSFQHAYACGRQNDVAGYVTNIWGILYGAGLCVKHQVIDVVLKNKTFVLSGRKGGERITSGDDSEICFHIALLGYELYYNPAMVFDHQIEANRLNWGYLHRLYYSFGQTHYYLYPLEQQVLNKVEVKKMPFKVLLKYWKKDWKNGIFYLIKGARYSGTVKGAWLIGLTKAFLN
jgi:glycosyltransferase involved in cell wall biosynthesis